MSKKKSPEKVVREIRQRTRRKFTAEEKMRVFEEKNLLLPSAEKMAFMLICITTGANPF